MFRHEDHVLSDVFPAHAGMKWKQCDPIASEPRVSPRLNSNVVNSDPKTPRLCAYSS